MKNRGTVDAIFIVLQIKETAKEHQVPLHLNCVNLKAAFDIIRREALWKMLRSIRVDYKITSLIEAMYDNVECNQLSTDRMVHSGNMSETGLFVITYPVPFVPGVRHGRFEERVQRVHS